VVIERKHPDYTASAESITQSPFIKHLLDDLHARENEAAGLQAVLAAYPEYNAMQVATEKAAAIRKQISDALPEHGGYQDIEHGVYALRQKAVSVTYPLEKVKAALPPEIAAKVVVESVDKAKVETLIHDRIITGAQVDAISESKTTFRNIIK